MFRRTIMKKTNVFKLSAILLILSTSAMSALAQDDEMITDELITGWQTPLAAEFSKLDVTGNGLILQNEASKNKAFNKKTFAKADADHDGSIDEAEYIQYKTATAP